jgi:hypothetical protein
VEELSRQTLGLEIVTRHLRYVLNSGFVKNKPYPLSTLLLAEPERAKTTLVCRFEGIGVLLMNDTTGYGVWEELKQIREEDGEDGLSRLHHLIIPDLERIRTRSKSTREELLSDLRMLMQEGLIRKHTAKMNVTFNPPVRMGLIMCTTPEDLGDKRSVLRSLSFLSRLIPFSYDYGSKLKVNIMKFVQEEEALRKDRETISGEETHIGLPSYIATELNFPSSILAKRTEKFSRRGDLIGIRYKEQFQTYLKSIAYSNAHPAVRPRDYDEFFELYEYMNYKFKEID